MILNEHFKIKLFKFNKIYIIIKISCFYWLFHSIHFIYCSKSRHFSSLCNHWFKPIMLECLLSSYSIWWV